MQRVTLSTIVLVTIGVASMPVSTFACGESLFRVGKGVAYRAYSAPIPANIIVYVETEQQRSFAEQLAQSGHEIRTTSSAAELEDLLLANDYDVVVAPYSAWSTVSRNEFAAAHYIPVLEAESASPIVAADEKFDAEILLDGNLKKHLRTIHAKLVASS